MASCPHLWVRETSLSPFRNSEISNPISIGTACCEAGRYEGRDRRKNMKELNTILMTVTLLLSLCNTRQISLPSTTSFSPLPAPMFHTAPAALGATRDADSHKSWSSLSSSSRTSHQFWDQLWGEPCPWALRKLSGSHSWLIMVTEGHSSLSMRWKNKLSRGALRYSKHQHSSRY